MIEARQLLQCMAENVQISGSELARRFGVSRAAIWKQVENLRALGAPIHARAGSGYALRAPIELLDRDAVMAALPARMGERLESIAVHWQLDSTNSEMLRHAQQDGSGMAACLCEVQSAGRGRRGRSWHLPLGGGLAMSLLRKFEAPMSSLAGLSLVSGIAVVQALERLGFAGVQLKWPNDVQAKGRKLAGILVELGGDALGPCHAVIGIGINVRLDENAVRSIDQPWIDLACLGEGRTPDRNRLAVALFAELINILDEFERSTFAAFVDRYAAYDALKGRSVLASNGLGGKALGIDARGRLRVRTADGEVAVDSGEISVRGGAETT